MSDLQKQLEMYRLLLDESADPLFSFTRDGQYIFANKAFARGVDRTLDQIVNKKIWDVFPKEEADKRFAALSQVFEAGLEKVIEVRVPRPDGDRYYMTTITPIKSADGTVSSVICSSKEITERRQIEQKLRIQQELVLGLNSCVNLHQGLYKVLEAVLQMGCLDCGGVYLVEPGEGALHLEVHYGLSKEFISQVSHFGADSANVRLVASGEAQYGSYTEIRPANDQIRDKEGLRAFALLPVMNQKHLIALLNLASHTSDFIPQSLRSALETISSQIGATILRLRADAALQESEKKYRLLFESAADAVFIHDEQGVMLAVNPKACEQLGYRRSELLAMNAGMVDTPQQALHIPERLARLIERGQYEFDTVHRRKDGSLVPTEVVSRRIVWGDHQAVMSICRDISERKKAEQEKGKLQDQLLHSQKMESVGRLAGGVAHDFNNMLGVILGYTDLSLAQLEPGHVLTNNLQEIRKAAERSSNLTRQLLAFARKQTIAPRVLDLNDTVSGMIKMLGRLIGEDIELLWLPGKQLWPVKMDPSQIDQILANLCVNARDAMSNGGRITIETQNSRFNDQNDATNPELIPGDFVCLTFSDTGCGMDSGTLSHLFEPFFTTKELGQGTGLGLATVYGIVKQNKGFIQVNSQPGQGTCFIIHLPRHVGRDAQHGEGSPSEALQRGQETVLLVEDEAAILKMTTEMLEMQGYAVLKASTPSEALHLAEAYPGEIHLLMTDVVMPEMNGRDLAKNLLSLYPDLKCLFMSGYTADIVAHHGVLDEGVCFMQKPFTMKDLTDKVREAVGKGGMMNEE